MDSNFKLVINGHTITGMEYTDLSGDIQCFFEFELKPNSPSVARLGGTYFRCNQLMGHRGNHSIQAKQMIHEVNISFPPEV